MMVGRLLSFWDGIFSGSMLIFQGIFSMFIFRIFLENDIATRTTVTLLAGKKRWWVEYALAKLTG